MVGSGICWRNRTSLRKFPSIPSRKPAWWPAATLRLSRRPPGLSHRAKSLRRGVRTTNGSDPTNTWRVKRIVRPAPSRTPASRQVKKRRFFGITIYHPEYSRARERNRNAAFRRESNRRKTIVEGTFASLDRMGWEKSRLRGLWKVDCEGYMAALAHNVEKWCGNWAKVSARQRPPMQLPRSEGTQRTTRWPISLRRHGASRW